MHSSGILAPTVWGNERENGDASAWLGLLDCLRGTVDVQRARLRGWAISRSYRSMGAAAHGRDGSALVRSVARLGARAEGTADAGIPEAPGGEYRRAGARGPRQLAVRRALPDARHAGDDDALYRHGDYRPA